MACRLEPANNCGSMAAVPRPWFREAVTGNSMVVLSKVNARTGLSLDQGGKIGYTPLTILQQSCRLARWF